MSTSQVIHTSPNRGVHDKKICRLRFYKKHYNFAHSKLLFLCQLCAVEDLPSYQLSNMNMIHLIEIEYSFITERSQEIKFKLGSPPDNPIIFVHWSL